MKQKLSPKQLELYKFIDKLLLSEWDPYGVNGVSQAQDEYHSYLPQIFQLAINNSSSDKIAKYLLSIEIERMGMSGNKKCCLSLAEKFVKKKNELGL